tara:strand:- start:769 stop:1437 length:669 start_codon:yes stop_codon:yes gene_type:complete
MNEWNSDRKNDRLHRMDIHALLVDFDHDYQSLNRVHDHILEGDTKALRLLEVIQSQREGTLAYDAFADSLISIGYVYNYSTFFMVDATYKSLVNSGRIQSFPVEVNMKLRDYYEAAAKQVDDNNHLVDGVAMNYYNEAHPFLNYMAIDTHSIEKNRMFFKDEAIRQHYSNLQFYFRTLALKDRIKLRQRQVDVYMAKLNQLDSLVRSHTALEDAFETNTQHE